MRIDHFMHALPGADLPAGLSGREATGLAADSRRVASGQVFVAVAGGHRFLDQARAAGALAAVVETPDPGVDLPQIQVDDTRRALAALASLWHGDPSARLVLAGVTGTNGKTTLAHLARAVLGVLGPVGMVGTVTTGWPGNEHASDMTTPDALELNRVLAGMVEAGCAACAMEVSSHALDQGRALGLAFDAAVFTNLTRDHLDYHQDMACYLGAKRRLFTELLPASRAAGKPARSVLCADDESGRCLAGELKDMGQEPLTYGFHQDAVVRGRGESLSLEGGRVEVDWPGGGASLSTRLVGRYNLQNLMGAFALALALNLEPGEAARRLADCPGVPGRVERVGSGSGPAVFVDYAHTDDALGQVLAALRPLTPGRLICMFGAGGDRDHGKRPLMGLAAGRGADMVVLTSDNPRSEDPLAIMAMIEPGLREAGLQASGDMQASGVYLSEPDRARAIALAVAAAGPDDAVVIAGKGHEDYQIVGGERRHLDDREEAAKALGVAYGPTGEGAAHA